MARKSISKKIRFEVFKRDSFKCQYCGKSAPDVLLQLDHIKPVAKGGGNEILNLVTACEACNVGKSDRELDSSAVVTKARTQLEALQVRREQLEMMSEWLEGLRDVKEQSIETAIRTWQELVPGFRVNERGKQSIRRAIRKFGFQELVEAMEIAVDQYLEYADDGSVLGDSCEKAFKKVPGICSVRAAQQNKPYLADLLYVRGILRNRVYVNENYVMELLENAVEAGATTDWLKQVARNCRNWTQFQQEVHEFIDHGGQ